MEMEVKYTISQVSKFTGITTDAIRLYEKEGLICPKRDDNNNYRYYDVEQIRCIMFIAFYRKIDVSIPEIAPLITSSSLSDIRGTFDELIKSNTEKIEQLRTKIEKLSALNKSLGELSTNIGVYSLCVMPKCYKMMEKVNADTESYKMGTAISSPMFSFGNIGYETFFDSDCRPTQRYMSFVIWENLINIAPVDATIENLPFVEPRECISTTALGHDNGIIEFDLSAMISYASSLGYRHSGYYYAFYVYAVPDGDSTDDSSCREIIDYYKIYMPVKKR